MHTRLQTLIRCYVEREAQRLAAVAQSLDSQAFLHLLSSVWEKFCAQMVTAIHLTLAVPAEWVDSPPNPIRLQGMIRSVFLFLDRTYRVQNASVVSLW